MPRVMAAHQPNFLPYLGFFDKMMQADIFIIRDEVQFVESDYHHRNRIRIDDGPDGAPRSKWLTVPVHKSMDDIGNIMLKQEQQVKKRPWYDDLEKQLLGVYASTPHFRTYFPRLQTVFRAGHKRLMDLNLDLICLLRDAFGIKTELVLASDVPGYLETGTASGNLAALCVATGADEYLAGAGGRAYMHHEPFDESGIAVRYHHFEHPAYRQHHPGFLPNMAAIDALFNVGTFPRAARGDRSADQGA